MRIAPINKLKYQILALGLFLTPHIAGGQKFLTEQKSDVFEYTQKVPPAGSNSYSVLTRAPSPRINIAGEDVLCKIVVNLANNVLYTYNDYGIPTMAYLVASGAKKTPTDEGIRVVSGIEKYPYRTASKLTKRYKKPRDYGPMALILRKVDPETGKTSPTGEFIHGNNNKNSLGTYASKGCIRMDNEVIKIIAQQVVNRGDYILITKQEQ